jgi:catalase
MVGKTWPIDGRTVGIVADNSTRESTLAEVRTMFDGAGVVPLVIAPHGGKLGGIPVQRAFTTATSAELDAVLVLAASSDPRVVKLLEEACRHGKAIAITDTARGQFDSVSFSADTAGVIFGDAAASTEGILGLLPAHRVWERLGSVQAG